MIQLQIKLQEKIREVANSPKNGTVLKGGSSSGKNALLGPQGRSSGANSVKAAGILMDTSENCCVMAAGLMNEESLIHGP